MAAPMTERLVYVCQKCGRASEQPCMSCKLPWTPQNSGTGSPYPSVPTEPDVISHRCMGCRQVMTVVFDDEGSIRGTLCGCGFVGADPPADTKAIEKLTEAVDGLREVIERKQP